MHLIVVYSPLRGINSIHLGRCLGLTLSDRSFKWLRSWISIGALFALALYLWKHEPSPALPPVFPPNLAPYANADFRLGTADAIKDILGLTIGLAFGLSAIVGFVIRDGFGTRRSIMLVNLSIFCGFAYFICRVFVFGYDCYAAIAVQLDGGFVLLRNLQQLVNLQIRSLALASAFAFALLFTNYVWIEDPHSRGTTGGT
jgi:hypothetical protein